jgi:hypothetical protein
MGARFCAQCGTGLAAGDRPEELAGELGPGDTLLDPMTRVYAERRVFGLAPPALVFGLALLGLLLAVVFMAGGHWLVGTVLLIVAVALGALFMSVARQLPQGRLAQAAVEVGDEARWRAGFAWVSMSSWSHAGREVVRLRTLQRRLRLEQSALIAALGQAVYAEDEERAGVLSADAHAREEQIEECERQLRLALAAARERVDRERKAIEPTRVLTGAEADPTAGADHS